MYPTKEGKLEFCSEVCLIGYRKAQKAQLPLTTNSSPAAAAAAGGDASPLTVTTAAQSHQGPSSKSPTMVSPRGRLVYDEDSETNFTWTEYLQECSGKPAPSHCFRQSSEPPKNEFPVDSKLEALDPRSQSVCLATVVGKVGSRVRLRLDGSDAKNDFWRVVDSSDLHEYGHCQHSGGMLQPPVGFTLNATSWHKFLDKTLAGAVFTPSHCFKREPSAPKRNFFEMGQKLEAVDRKNPHLICCATVGAVNQDQIHVQFDGWKGAFDYWCKFDCRDIFPVGWCQASDHPLQPPGTKVRLEACT